MYINVVFSLGHLVIFGGKPENCEILDSFRENHNFSRDLSKDFFSNKSLNNELYEYEAILLLFKRSI